MSNLPPPSQAPSPSPASSPSNSPDDATERRTRHTTPVADAASQDELALPHERDQSDDTALDEQASPKVVRQAARDLEAGLVDTDMRGTPNAGSARRDELLQREAERGSDQP
jgi:hypothetical protein